MGKTIPWPIRGLLATLVSFLISCRRRWASSSLPRATPGIEGPDEMVVSWYFFPSPSTVPLRARQRHRGELQRRRRLVTAATRTTPSSLAGSAIATSMSHHCWEERRLPLPHLLGPEKLTIAIVGRSTRSYSSRQSGYSCIAWKGIKLRKATPTPEQGR